MYLIINDAEYHHNAAIVIATSLVCRDLFFA